MSTPIKRNLIKGEIVRVKSEYVESRLASKEKRRVTVTGGMGMEWGLEETCVYCVYLEDGFAVRHQNYEFEEDD